jgi:uncharacterized protein involved in exopolysaccharide biosynthesis
MPEMMPESESSFNDSLDYLWNIVIRRRWWILVAASSATFVTLILLTFVPNRYRSEATLLVTKQQVPERYVLPTTTTDIRAALQATTEEVLSRTRLLAIIDEFSLYSQERKRFSPEGLLDLMRRDIEIVPLESEGQGRDVNSFKISFTARNPELAREVTTRLTSLFIEQNLETREHQATTTTKFLQEQLETAKAKLEEGEQQVGGFKMAHLGELPEQRDGNLAILGGLQAELQTTMSSLNRAREQRQYLDSLSDNRALVVQGDLARLQAQKEALMLRYTPEYPAVQRLDVKIAQTEALLETLRDSQIPGTGKPKAAARPASAIGIADDASIAQINGQLESNRLEIANLTKE